MFTLYSARRCADVPATIVKEEGEINIRSLVSRNAWPMLLWTPCYKSGLPLPLFEHGVAHYSPGFLLHTITTV